MGIAYAYPDMGEQNFWGVINQQNQEGIFRIADNTITHGLKMWTFGYDSVTVDIEADGNNWSRPFIELWAGLTPEFWQRTTLSANSVLTFDEVYAPTVGLNSVTHANNNLLLNATCTDDILDLQWFSLILEIELRVTVESDDNILESIKTTSDLLGNQLQFDADCQQVITFTIEDANMNVWFFGTIQPPINNT